MVIDLGLKLPEGSSTAGGATSATMQLDFQLLDVNEDQEIEAPDNAKPFAELLKQFDGLGLGQLGLGGAGGAQPNVDEYSKCVQDNLGDDEAVRKCGDLLTNP
jgi:hypothetical protein